jgi:hypothetical protein
MKGTQGSIARQTQSEEEARLHPEMGGQNLEGVVGWVCRRCPIPKYVSSATLLAETYMTVRLSWMIGKYTDSE